MKYLEGGCGALFTMYATVKSCGVDMSGKLFLHSRRRTVVTEVICLSAPLADPEEFPMTQFLAAPYLVISVRVIAG